MPTSRNTKTSNPRIRTRKSQSWDWSCIVYIRKAVVYPTNYPWLVFVPGQRVQEYRWNEDAMAYARSVAKPNKWKVIKGFRKEDLESWD